VRRTRTTCLHAHAAHTLQPFYTPPPHTFTCPHYHTHGTCLLHLLDTGWDSWPPLVILVAGMCLGRAKSNSNILTFVYLS